MEDNPVLVKVSKSVSNYDNYKFGFIIAGSDAWPNVFLFVFHFLACYIWLFYLGRWSNQALAFSYKMFRDLAISQNVV